MVVVVADGVAVAIACVSPAQPIVLVLGVVDVVANLGAISVVAALAAVVVGVVHGVEVRCAVVLSSFGMVSIRMSRISVILVVLPIQFAQSCR